MRTKSWVIYVARKRETNKYTCSRSIPDSISNIGLDSTPRILLQIILVHMNTINVALIPNPITVVIKFIPEPHIWNSSLVEPNCPKQQDLQISRSRFLNKWKDFQCRLRYKIMYQESQSLVPVGGLEDNNKRHEKRYVQIKTRAAHSLSFFFFFPYYCC